MINFYLTIFIFAFLHALIALFSGEYGYGIGLLGGAGAWMLLAVKDNKVCDDKEEIT